MTLVPVPSYWEFQCSVAGGQANKNQRVKVQKASPKFACRQGRCRKHLRRLGCAAWVSHGRGASLFARAFAVLAPRRGSRGGALAQVFAETATLALTTPPAMNRSRPIRSPR
jgi:hypothetical protein